MVDTYAFLRGDGSLLYARRKGATWQVDDRRRDVGARGRKVCVIVSGLEVLGLQSVIPARNDAQARRAAPFAVEDDVAEPIEDSHVAIGPRPDEQQMFRSVHVVSSQRMQDLVARLAAAGLPDASLIAAHGVLPPGNHLVDAGNVVFGRLGGRTFTLERSIGNDVLLGMIDGHDDVQVHGATLAAALQRSPAGDDLPDEAAVLKAFAGWAEDQTSVDLRQGAFQVRRSLDLTGIEHWRWVAGLAAALVMGWFFTNLLQTRAMQARTAELDTRITAFVDTGWPDAGGDPQRAFAEISSSSSGTSREFPSVLTATAVLFAGLDGVQGSELRSLRYDRQRRQLAAVVAFEEFGGTDALTAAIEKSGLTVRAGDARQIGNRVLAELTLEAEQ